MTQNHDPSEIAKLTAELERLNGHRFIKVHGSMWRLISYQFMRGLAFGLGSVLGATVLVAWLVYFLGQVDFIPIIGDWTQQIIDDLQTQP